MTLPQKKLFRGLFLAAVGLLLWLALRPAFCGEWLRFDSERRVPWANDASYTRDEYHWFVENTGQPTRLWQNGVLQSQETGNFDLGLVAAWALQPGAAGVKVSCVTLPNGHGAQIVSLVGLVAPGADVILQPVARYYPDVLAGAIAGAVTAGSRIVVLDSGSATSDAQLSNTIRNASETIFVCSTPNTPQDLDALPDFPTSWNFPNVLGVSALDRAGLPYWSGTGSNTLAAPGRNIAINNLYSSGTSYAAPIAAGCLALMIAAQPHQSPEWYLRKLRDTAGAAGATRRINPLAALQNIQPACVLTVLTNNALTGVWQRDESFPVVTRTISGSGPALLYKLDVSLR